MKSKLSVLLFICVLLQLQGQGELDQILERSITEKGVDYKHLKLNEAGFIEAVDAFLGHEMMIQAVEAQVAAKINAYNLIVLREVTKLYPISSVKSNAAFFDRKHMVFGEELSLNALEKNILSLKPDPRIHFILVCGAKSCPELSPTLVTMGNLEEELERATQAALANPRMLDFDDSKKEIQPNAIFNWFTNDFGSDIKSFLTPYFPDKDLADYTVQYQSYDWSLNSLSVVPNVKRYLATRLYNRGEFEIHVFNNYYTQKETGSYEEFNFGRHNFNSILTALLVGINNRLNVGLGVRARSVYQDRSSTDGVFKALRFAREETRIDINDRNIGYTRSGITAVYPFVRYAPFASHSNINITHTLFVPTGDNLEGQGTGRYIDWDNISINNQLFYTKSLGLKKELFVDFGLLIDNIGSHVFSSSDASGFTQFGLPTTAILNFFPRSGVTYYGLLGVAPRMTVSSGGGSKNIDFNGFTQLGAGFKYFIHSSLEIESLYTLFLDTTPNRISHTFNIGLRYFNR